MMEYGGWGVADWRKVKPLFEASMRLVRTERGRSAVRFILEDTSTGVQYPTFLVDMEYIINNSVIERGKIPAMVWRFVKRGQNYGIALDKQVSK